jgi:putative membrane protein
MRPIHAAIPAPWQYLQGGAQVFMTRCFLFRVITATSLVFLTALAIGAQVEPIPALEESYLQKAGERHQAEVALGQLALQKASSDRVKQYAARMIQDHQKAIEEVQKLIRKEGELSMPHQEIQRKLSQLSGKDFDRAYMSVMVQDHGKDLDQLEQRASTVTNPRVQRWMADALRTFKDHLDEATAIAVAMGINAGSQPITQDSTSQ